ncbi:hypothetical protein MCHI_001484 [Candidatus Magnetoovum chiemensis]|nr:hypothetical protein MCHI_001484 [Candidatus Magnetoovum chiemensis]
MTLDKGKGKRKKEKEKERKKRLWKPFFAKKGFQTFPKNLLRKLYAKDIKL